MRPESITARTGTNKLGAALCSVFAIIPLFLAVDLTRLFSRYERVAIGDWTLVGVLYGTALLVALFCVWLWRKPQWRGAWVEFRNSGMDIKVRSIWGRESNYGLKWCDVERVSHVELPRSASYVALRLRPEAAMRSGVTLPTTRETASTKLVPREVRIGIALVHQSGAEIVQRLKQSAESSGYLLERRASLNVLFFERYVWTVVTK